MFTKSLPMLVLTLFMACQNPLNPWLLAIVEPGVMWPKTPCPPSKKP